MMWERGARIQFEMTVVEGKATRDNGGTQWGEEVEQVLICSMKEHCEEVGGGVITTSNLQISKLKFKVDM